MFKKASGSLCGVRFSSDSGLSGKKDEAGQIIAMPFLSTSGGLNDILR